jgi:transcriptional regulator NrdR family protein
VLRKDGADRRRRCTGCGQRFTTTEMMKDEAQRLEEAGRVVVEAAARLKVEA